MNEVIASEKSPNANAKEDGRLIEALGKLDKPLLLVDNQIKKERRTFLFKSHKIDYVALIFFGLLFVLFNLIYWLYYLLC